MLAPTPHLTLERRSAEPTPMMEELTTWVVLTGPPKRDAANTIAPELLWEENAWIGRMR